MKIRNESAGMHLALVNPELELWKEFEGKLVIAAWVEYRHFYQ